MAFEKVSALESGNMEQYPRMVRIAVLTGLDTFVFSSQFDSFVLNRENVELLSRLIEQFTVISTVISTYCTMSFSSFDLIGDVE